MATLDASPRCPDDNLLGLLADGRLDGDARAAVERHLDGCAACSRLVGELAQLTPAPATPERYVVLRPLGAGGMGAVWAAEDRQLGRKVALKWLHVDAGASERDRGRLLREARALAQLRHANVLAVHDVCEVGDELALVLELVDGMTARAWQAAAPRTTAEILAVWRQVAAGLSAVHRAGIVHRDVKPENVLVASDGRVLLGDFGLATAHPDDAGARLTVTGQVLGTPRYMAPEQLRGEPVTAQSDQFALCICLWEALAGARPFHGATTAALAVAMLSPPAIPAHVDRRVFATLRRGLAASPDRRWPDLDSLVGALPAARGEPARARPRAIGVAVVVAAAAGAAAWKLVQTADPPRAGAAPPGAAPRSAVAPAPPPTAAAAPPPVAADAGAPPARVASHRAPPASELSPGPAGGRPRGPAPLPSHVDWNRHESRVTDRLAARDGAGCLVALAQIRPADAEQTDAIARYRGMCLMLTGDCAGGRAALAAGLPGDGSDDPARRAERQARYLDAQDATWCPLDAAPEARWPARVESQLRDALAHHASCAPILAFVDAHQLALSTGSLTMRLTCEVEAHDCTAARRTFDALHAGREPAQLDRSFAEQQPTCAP